MQKNTHCRYDIKYPAQNFFYFQTASPLHYHLLSRLHYNIPQNIRLSKTKLFKKRAALPVCSPDQHILPQNADLYDLKHYLDRRSCALFTFQRNLRLMLRYDMLYDGKPQSCAAGRF